MRRTKAEATEKSQSKRAVEQKLRATAPLHNTRREFAAKRDSDRLPYTRNHMQPGRPSFDPSAVKLLQLPVSFQPIAPAFLV